MRSVLGGLACAWFVIAGLTIQEAEVATMLHDVAWRLFVGLALLSAAAIDWPGLLRRFDRWEVRPRG